MAQWNGTIITTAGRTLLGKVLAGLTTLQITRGAAGDGKLSAGQKMEDLTALISPKLNLPIASKKVNGDGTASVVLNITNTSLASLLEFREYGLYAQDPDVGEILYCVDNAGDYPDYIPAGTGPNLINYNMNVVTVIGSVINLDAKIDPNLTWASETQVQAHLESTNPHPNWLQIKTEVTTTDKFWVQSQSDNQLHPISVDNARTLILGDQASTIPVLSGRVNQVETELSNIALKLVAENDCPDSNMLLAEDFATPDKIDTFAVQVLSIVAGDNGIDVQTLNGIIPGAWYWVTDGVNQEYIQVKSCIKNGSVYRILVNSNIANTYTVTDTMIYRTTAEIGSSVAYGSGDKKGFNWVPGTTWAGVSANAASVVKVDTSQSNADSFTKTGDVAFTADGLFTLATN